MPALGLTDHGVLNGAVEFYKACRKHGVKPILGLEAYLADDRREREKVRYERNHLTLLARRRRRLPEPDQAVLARLPGGLSPRPGERRPGAAGAPFGGGDRPLGMSPVPFLPADHPGARAGGPRPRRRPDGRVRRGERLLRGPEQQDPGAGPRERGHRADRSRAGPPAGRDGGRPLPAPRGLLDPRRAAVRADEVDARAAEAELRHERVLFEGRGRDGGGLPRVAGGRPDHARDRRALRHRAGAGQPPPAELRDTGRIAAGRVPAAPHAGGPARALRRPAPGGGRRAPRDRARRDREDGLRVVLPDRVGLRQVREGQRHRGRDRGEARRRARSSATCCGSPTSTRSPRTCCSSGS